MNCKNHADKNADFICTACGNVYCLDCVRKFLAGEFYTYFCPDCNSPCDDFSEEKYQRIMQDKLKDKTEKSESPENVSSTEKTDAKPIVAPQSKTLLKSTEKPSTPEKPKSGLMQAKAIKIDQPKITPAAKDTSSEKTESAPQTSPPQNNTSTQKVRLKKDAEKEAHTENITEEILTEQDDGFDAIDNLEALEKMMAATPVNKEEEEEYKSKGILKASMNEADTHRDVLSQGLKFSDTSSGETTTRLDFSSNYPSNPFYMFINMIYSLINPPAGANNIMNSLENKPAANISLFFIYLLSSSLSFYILLERFSLLAAAVFVLASTFIYSVLQTILTLPVKPPSAKAIIIFCLTLQSLFLIPLNYAITRLDTNDWMPLIIPAALVLLLWKTLIILFSFSSRFKIAKLIFLPTTLASFLLSSYLSIFLVSHIN